MNFEDLEAGKSYYRDRSDEWMGLGISYFEELKVNSVKNSKANVDRIHIYLNDDVTFEYGSDRGLEFNKKGWNSGWYNLKFMTKKEMNRKNIVYVFKRG